MLISEAFSKYGCTLKNVNWSVSAFNNKNELVLSLWDQYFEKIGQGSLTYIDQASRWNGHGNKEFISNLNKAIENKSNVRAVIAKTDKPDAVANGGDASKLKNTFSVKPNWLGAIEVWDGDNFQIKFTPES
jgi:hypothetical protein